MRTTLLVDLDHTVFDSAWRDNLMGADGSDWGGWDAYHLASEDDPPATDIIGLINTLHFGGDWMTVAITARPEKWRFMTMRQLVRHEVQIDVLLMRPENDYRKTPEVKVELFEDACRRGLVPREDVAFILDDRDDVCAAFKAIGITALQVYNRKYRGDNV
jgi:hypothetical protein